MINSKVPKVLPDGTTHFCPAFGRYPNRAFKLTQGDQWSYWTGFNWHQPRQSPPPSIRREMIDVRPKVTGPSIAELIEQGYLAAVPFKCTPAPVTPKQWNGPEDGLPPVGLEVTTDHSGRTFKVRILAYAPKNGKTAVMVEEIEPGDNKGCLFAWMAHMCNFRPIRTAEQLAAEAHRAKYMPQLIKLWDADTERTEFLEAVYALIVEAGKP